ncbi:tRNA ligase [Durotheca rogersii]|uniref:tRNA ligase n=1 Tax=Durotheca rogersii TaxID=419775 RepID=UPI002220DFDB|nr:tRNA ligase [Durotheca rogersii]KAI5862490.1 tRNA ligase [Durotheca rogersii]
MESSNVPYRSQDPSEVATMIRALGSGASKARARKTTYKVKGSPTGITVDSWRLHDWNYKKSGLPTYARGLFTAKTNGGQEIAIRGYDKFFNIFEVPETRWPTILKCTKGPYELTLKENGCIIFISGLEDGTLLICSKHATGDRSDVELSHAGAGEKWIDRQLASLGKTRQEFAQELRRRNVTAVAELCDDEFEEHILAYGPDVAGLYLHGINVNVPEFLTYSGELVHQFAEEWGFRKIGLQLFDDVNSVKSFLETVAETGSHDGRPVEGFVIRCKMSTDPDKKPFTDWFFKYKFEEPYLMYRQWRECTKAMIAGETPKIRKHVKITQEYLAYARKRLAADPKLGKAYQANHGIIPLRDDFLAFKHLKGSEAANIADERDDKTIANDVVLVTIATLGCGKTTVGVALTHLFGWGLVQNDNIRGPKRPVQMVDSVSKLLMKHPVVISDRNNSERWERQQILEDVRKRHLDVTMIALNFSHSDFDAVRKVTEQRVLNRGNNHQTIQAASDKTKVIKIMENFLSRFEPCDPSKSPDNGFDFVIDLDPTLDSRANVETVIRELHGKYPALVPEIPSAEAMDEAVKAAIEDYKPDLRHTIPARKQKQDKRDNAEGSNAEGSEPTAAKKKPLEYMSISIPTPDVSQALEAAFKGTDPETQRFYKQLQQTRRIQARFHVTLMHRASSREHPDLWQRYVSLEAEKGTADGALGECEVILERVVFDDRIMAIAVRLVDAEQKWTCVNKVPHITVGTRDFKVKPKESNGLLGRWLEIGSGGDTGIGERLIEGGVTVKGTVHGVLSS